MTQLAQAVTGAPKNYADALKQFESLISGKPKQKTQILEEGTVIEGMIVGLLPDKVLVDVGFKSEGVILKEEFGGDEPAVGAIVKVFVDWLNADEGTISLSKEKADRMRVWDEIEKIADANGTIKGLIEGKVKGGLSVDIGVKAFLPGSQVDLKPIKDLGDFVGQEMEFAILKHNRMRNNIVLSRRVLLEKEREAMRGETLKDIAVGRLKLGVVKNITDYGAFVDLGGVDGLLHITDMSWGRIAHPSEMLNIGDEIEVMVLSFDKERERVSLGIKQKMPDPWLNVEERYPAGTVIEVKVVSITDYGAFVELEEGIEGLVHVSEMSWTEKNVHPSRLVAMGAKVKVVVQNVDVENRRISLSMRETMPNPWIEVAQKYPPGTIIEGEIKNITDFGVFIGVEKGIDGLVHVSDISWTKRINHPKEVFKKAERVRAVVLNVDVENERFSLGIKQLSPDPWETMARDCPPGTLVKGAVTHKTEFGIFVRISEGMEGLVHKSELADGTSVEDYEVGQEIEACVLEVDSNERRISLSLAQIEHAEELQAAAASRPMSEIAHEIKTKVLREKVEDKGD